MTHYETQNPKISRIWAARWDEDNLLIVGMPKSANWFNRHLRGLQAKYGMIAALCDLEVAIKRPQAYSPDHKMPAKQHRLPYRRRRARYGRVPTS